MTDSILPENEKPSSTTSYVSTLLDKIEKITQDYRQKESDLYCIVEEQKLIQAAKQTSALKQKPVVAVAKTDLAIF